MTPRKNVDKAQRLLVRLLSPVLMGGMLLAGTVLAAQRVQTYQDAQSRAGNDGIIAYWYGPDWNKRSVRMLKSFWSTPALEEACGKAVLVALPFYQDSSADKTGNAGNIISGAPKPPFSVCPCVLMITKEGKVYASLVGSDYLGPDESGAMAIETIRTKLEAMRTQQELMQKQKNLVGQEKLQVLTQIEALPIPLPDGFDKLLDEADPADKSGLARRTTHDCLQFMYRLLDTTDGFLKPDYIPDVKRIQKETTNTAQDKVLRPLDRQKALALQVGEMRRQGYARNKITSLTKQMEKIDKTTDYGRLAADLGDAWKVEQKKTGEQKKADAERQKAQKQKQREKQNQDRRNKHSLKMD